MTIEYPHTNGFPAKKKQNANHLSSHQDVLAWFFLLLLHS